MQTNRHINKTILFLFLISLPATFAESPSFNYDVDGKGNVTIGKDKREFNSLSPAEKENALHQMRLNLDNPDNSVQRESARALLSLNDSEATVRVVDRYHSKGSFYSEMEECGRETLIAELVPDLSVDREIRVHVGGYSPVRLKESSAALLLMCVQHCDDLPAATRKWAYNLHDELLGNYMLLDQISDQIKQWWEHNKDAVSAKQYDKATWLPTEKIDAKN